MFSITINMSCTQMMSELHGSPIHWELWIDCQFQTNIHIILQLLQIQNIDCKLHVCAVLFNLSPSSPPSHFITTYFHLFHFPFSSPTAVTSQDDCFWMSRFLCGDNFITTACACWCHYINLLMQIASNAKEQLHWQHEHIVVVMLDCSVF